jgi:hypothetical protein
MAQLQPGIQIEVEPISHNTHIEFGKNLSTLIDEICRYANNSTLPNELIVEDGNIKVTLRVNK